MNSLPQSSVFKNTVLPILMSSFGSLLISITSLQSPITTFYSNPTVDQKVAAAISITSIVIHFFITIFVYISESPMQTNINSQNLNNLLNQIAPIINIPPQTTPQIQTLGIRTGSINRDGENNV